MSIRNLLRLLPLLAMPLAVSWSASAYAASDTAMLQSYAGNYLGTGALSGANTGTVHCRISLQPATPTSINYIGRCSAEGADMALTGVISLHNGHLEAAMSGSGGMATLVTGVRRGGGVVFKSKQRMVDGSHDRTIDSTMALTGGTIEVDFSMLDNKTGKATTGQIPFVRLKR